MALWPAAAISYCIYSNSKGRSFLIPILILKDIDPRFTRFTKQTKKADLNFLYNLNHGPNYVGAMEHSHLFHCFIQVAPLPAK